MALLLLKNGAIPAALGLFFLPEVSSSVLQAMTFLKTVLQCVYVKRHKLLIQTAELQQKHCQEPSRVHCPHTLSVLAYLHQTTCTLITYAACTRAGRTAASGFSAFQTANCKAGQQADWHLCCQGAKANPPAEHHLHLKSSLDRV